MAVFIYTCKKTEEEKEQRKKNSGRINMTAILWKGTVTSLPVISFPT